jgi:hypothetical protein
MTNAPAASSDEIKKASLRKQKCDYMKKWVAARPEQQLRVRERAKRQRLKRRDLIIKFKSVPCMDCHIQYPPYVMQFDHRDPAEKCFGLANRKVGSTNAAFLAEVAKCDIVCANCHAERTHKQRIAGLI